ncbi:hypothetical protein [Lacipirellula sp.]|uniref:hypothetical protein n=1 Tax=Lacipirellula sp. TaxID=2691419 RepID=UPI003D0F4343
MVEIVVSSPAEQEYAEALTWYAQRSLRVAQRFDDDFDQSRRLPSDSPSATPAIASF